MEEITIVIHPDTEACTVQPGIVKSARMVWHAPGLVIYVSGAMPLRLYGRVCNVAVNECINRHIPTLSLKGIGISKPQHTTNEDDGQRRLFDDD